MAAKSISPEPIGIVPPLRIRAVGQMNDAEMRPEGLQPLDRIPVDRKCVGDNVDDQHLGMALDIEEASDIGGNGE